MQLTFTVYGFGEVGSLVAALINSNFSDCLINVINTQNKLNGRILDLQHAATFNNNQIIHNAHSKVGVSDFIIYAAGFSNVHGESRNSVALKNKKMVYDIFSTLTLNSKTKIIAITNPVEPIAYWINDAIKGKAMVIGTGTALDTFRLKHILSEHFSADSSQIKATVIGEHGQHMVPLFSKCSINSKLIIDLAKKSDLQILKIKLEQAAFEIRKTEDATKYGIAQTCIRLIHAFLSEETTLIPVSIGLTKKLQSEFVCNLPVYVSLECEISQSGIKIIPLKCSNLEKEQLQIAAKAIEEIILNTI